MTKEKIKMITENSEYQTKIKEITRSKDEIIA